jgi:hypothetical protein
MAAKAKCFITQSDEGSGAYGIRADTDENVYFPKKLADAVELTEFDEIEAIRNERPDPPWMAIRVRRLDTAG